jgi:sugar phosphate isomerase/epimerase
MFDKLGIVTNCLSKRLADNDSFEKLIGDFIRNGFLNIEIRDGDYLRQSNFGDLLKKTETAIQHYTDAQWRQICVALHRKAPPDIPALRSRDRRHIIDFHERLQTNPKVVLSYAMAHAWTGPAQNMSAEDFYISRAKKLAYLLSPDKARLRLVDLAVEQPLDENTALSNLRRYRSLVPECPVALVVENSQLPPHVVLNLATQSNVTLAYDEANNFHPDGKPLGDTKLFWEHLQNHHLSSVHLKQKDHDGVCARLGEGFVDFPGLLKQLFDRSYDGDWLLEYRATDHPVQDAIQSRKVLMSYRKQKGVSP